PFELDARTQPSVRAFIGEDNSALVEATLGPAPQYATKIRTVRVSHGVEVPSLEASRAVTHVGETLQLEDHQILAVGGPYVCEATLITRPTIDLDGIGTLTAPLTVLTKSRATMDIPLPNRTMCGLKLAFSAPVTQAVADKILAQIDASADDGR